MYILRACRGNPCPQCRLRAEPFDNVAEKFSEDFPRKIGFDKIVKPDLIWTFGNSGSSPLRWKSGSATLPDPIFTCIRVSVLTIGCLHCGVLNLHYNPYKGVHVSTLEVKKSRAGCIMRPPFFFFNADTDCPHYLLGWVREPGMALEPSPERRCNMNTQTHRTCIRMSQEEYALLKEKNQLFQ